MKFFIKPTAFILVIELCATASAQMVPYTKQWNVKLKSLPPSQVLTKLDLDRPGLEAVKAAAGKGDRSRALAELLRYYRGKYPPPPAASSTSRQTYDAADGICRHVFQWGPYKPADYGTNIDWTINPADDIEWVAAIYRFYWADDLAKAYTAARDDKYARAFVELTTDWIAKHPLDDWTRTHPTLTHWKGFAWLDLQTGIRATKAVSAFKAMLHSDAVTPEFLAVFLAGLYDHQHKTEMIPMGVVHNKAIFEQRGVLSICHAVPEFSETPRWAKLALERARENLLGQTTPEGVQREWCGSYHLAVLNDSIDMMEEASQLGLAVPDDYRRRVRGMCDYVFAVATPNLGWPMFGDTARYEPTTKDRTARLYDPLLRFSEVWNDPKYAARAKLDETALPKQMSYAFESAGVYCLRSQWGPEGTYLALHCAPPALGGHDQPDNGTFELYALGRWLMTDSGFYTYGHDREARAWHRQTRVHQTLTLDGKDSKTDGRLRLWHSSPELDALVVENPSYEGLLHRRTVWFVDKKFYVFLDEAIGQAPGELCVHWTPAPGTGRISSDRTSFTTQFPDANVLIHTAEPLHSELETEDGWFAWEYGHRSPRKVLSVKHPDAAPAAFLTVVAPYRGTTPPEVEASLAGDYVLGSDEAQVSVRAFGKRWRIGRKLDKRTAWCVPMSAAKPPP
ncbi:MAG TPA: alginate lyase family protein [Phycisphaerae bacterium]|nr:alginate lyase family protein [Phycisphaerae bacterium]